MAKNLRDQGYPASHKDAPFKSRKVNYAQGEASTQRTAPTNDYMRGQTEDLDDNHQQDYINTLLGKAGSPFNVNRWNERMNVSNADWQDTIQKGYTLNQGDTRLALAHKIEYPSGRSGTHYGAVIDNLEPILGDNYGGWYSGDTPFGSVGVDYDGSLALSYDTPSQKQQMYYVNALMNLLNRGQ